jgi:hypothetical protein
MEKIMACSVGLFPQTDSAFSYFASAIAHCWVLIALFPSFFSVKASWEYKDEKLKHTNKITAKRLILRINLVYNFLIFIIITKTKKQISTKVNSNIHGLNWSV